MAALAQVPWFKSQIFSLLYDLVLNLYSFFNLMAGLTSVGHGSIPTNFLCGMPMVQILNNLSLISVRLRRTRMQKSFRWQIWWYSCIWGWCPQDCFVNMKFLLEDLFFLWCNFFQWWRCTQTNSLYIKVLFEEFSAWKMSFTVVLMTTLLTCFYSPWICVKYE